MAFLRALLPLPFLFLLARRSGKVTALHLKRGILPGCALFGCTLLLYSSYRYISPGLATTLHFLYPLYVILFEAAVQGRRIGKTRVLGLAAALAGLCCLLNFGSGEVNITGIVLALLSGVCYAIYILLLEREAVAPMPLYHLMFSVSLVGCVLCAAAGLTMGALTFSLTARAWLCAAAVALLTALVGCALFQYGVRRIGKVSAALLSLFEPLTSLLFSALLLGDSFSPLRLTGCVLILLGLVMSALGGKQNNEPNAYVR